MLTVADILRKKGHHVETLPETATVLDAAQRMNAARIGAIVIAGEGQALAGICTERDILTRVVAQRRDPATTRLADVMTRRVACCHLAMPLEECEQIMTQNRLRHLPVMAEGGLTGIVSIGDLLAAQLAEQAAVLHSLEDYVYGTR